MQVTVHADEGVHSDLSYMPFRDSCIRGWFPFRVDCGECRPLGVGTFPAGKRGGSS